MSRNIIAQAFYTYMGSYTFHAYGQTWDVRTVEQSDMLRAYIAHINRGYPISDANADTAAEEMAETLARRVSENYSSRDCVCPFCSIQASSEDADVRERGWGAVARLVYNTVASFPRSAVLFQDCRILDYSERTCNRLRREREEREAEENEGSEECYFEGYREGDPVREGRGRLCGVEWEFNTCSTPSHIRAWARKNGAGIHSDGSCGWEAVTPPMGGRAVARILGELATAFQEADTEINESCGIHVHVDARDYMWGDLYRLLAVWAKVEDAMFLLGGQSRSNNHYCKATGKQYARALQHPTDKKGAVLAVAYGAYTPEEGRTVARGRPGKKHGGRYKSLNLCPWLNGRTQRPRRPDSTIEFRLHRNSANGWRVIGWTHLCTALVEWCANHADADVATLPLDGMRALCVIAPHLKGWIVRRVKAWRKATKHTSRMLSFRGGMVRSRGSYGPNVRPDVDDGDRYSHAAEE